MREMFDSIEADKWVLPDAWVEPTIFRLGQYRHLEISQSVDSTRDRECPKGPLQCWSKAALRACNIKLTPISQLFLVQSLISSQLIPIFQIKYAMTQEAHVIKIASDLQYYLQGIFN